MSSERAPEIAEVIRSHIGGTLDETHTMLPAVVTAYDAALQRVSVKPLVKHAFFDEAQVRQLESLGIVSNVPVQFLSAGGFVVSVPISDGSLLIDGVKAKATMGALLFAEASLDRWLSGTGSEVDPQIDHRFHLTDAVFIPGLNPFGAPLAGIPTDHAFVGYAGGVGIHYRKDVATAALSSEELTAGYVALAAKVDAFFNSLRSTILGAGVGGDALSVALKGALILPPWPTVPVDQASTAATRLKSA